MKTINLPEEYINFVRKTRAYPITTLDSGKNYVRMGYFGELGEVATLIKKAIFNFFELEAIAAKLFDELSDVIWYLTAYAIENYATHMVMIRVLEPVTYADIEDFRENLENIFVFSSNLMNNNSGIITYSILSYVFELVIRALDMIGYTFEQALAHNMKKITNRMEKGEKQFSEGTYE